MKNESIARRLRIRHGISVSALAHAAGISKSRLVFMEGEESPRTEYQRKMLQRAYENLITERRNASDRLEHDYLRVKEHLCEIEDILILTKWIVPLYWRTILRMPDGPPVGSKQSITSSQRMKNLSAPTGEHIMAVFLQKRRIKPVMYRR